MKLIYIRSTMEPKNYSTIRSVLKKEQGEKIAPYIFKINDTQTGSERIESNFKVIRFELKKTGFNSNSHPV